MSRPHTHRIRDAVLTACAGVLMIGLAGLGGSAQAATPYPPSAPVCTVSPGQPAADSNVDVSCTGFDPGTTVNVDGGGSGLTLTASAIIDSSGGATVTEKVGDPGNASWAMAGRLPGGSPGKGVAKAAVNGRGRINRANVRFQVGRLSRNPVRVGDKFVFSGCGYDPGTTVAITDTAGDSFGTAIVGRDGCFHKTLSMSNAGNFTLVGTGEAADGSALVTTANLTVEAALFTNGGGRDADPGQSLAYTDGLAFTGADGIGMLVLIGGGLMAAGTGLVARGRRRQLVRTV